MWRSIAAWAELGDDPPRYLVAGADQAGNLLELVVRRSTQRELFD